MRALVIIVALVVLTTSSAAAQPPAQGGGGGGRGGRQGGPPPPGRAGAQFDLTGTWVSVVTEDWRWRMVTPAKGDYASVPLNAEGRRVADTWDLTKDNAAGEQCRAFGAAAIMRVPTRVRIAWADDMTLKLETDAGTQTRLFRFASAATSAGDTTWQGVSEASWSKQQQTRGLGFGAPPQGPGVLKVVTTRMKPGYLRSNGVPYSDAAVLTEYFNRHTDFGTEWFTVTTVVEDPRYLTQPFITSSSFKKEADESKFAPTPCDTPAPHGAPITGTNAR